MFEKLKKVINYIKYHMSYEYYHNQLKESKLIEENNCSGVYLRHIGHLYDMCIDCPYHNKGGNKND